MTIPTELQRQYGITEGSLVFAEPHDEGILIRPAVARPADEYKRRRFFRELKAAYDELRATPEAWREELHERAEWDVVLADGLDLDEEWSEEGRPRNPGDG